MKILVYSASGIGDLVFTLPVINLLKDKLDCKIDLLIGGTKNNVNYINQLSLICNNAVSRVFYYNSKEIIHDLFMLFLLKKQNYDYCIVLRYNGQPYSIFAEKIINLCCSRVIAVKNFLPFHSKLNVTTSVLLPKSDKIMHCVESYFLPLSALNIDYQTNISKYFHNLFKKEKLGKTPLSFSSFIKKNNYVTICIGANPISRKVNGKIIQNNVKIWNIENWISLSTRLLDVGINVVFLGGKKEKQMLLSANLPKKENFLNLTGSLSLAESVNVLHNSSIVIGCDTGLMHIAASLNVSSIFLLGPTSPTQFSGYSENCDTIFLHYNCAPCFGTGRDLACKENICIRNITVESVYHKVLNKINLT